MLTLEEMKQCGFRTFDLLALRTTKPVGLLKQVPSVINFTHNLKPAYSQISSVVQTPISIFFSHEATKIMLLLHLWLLFISLIEDFSHYYIDMRGRPHCLITKLCYVKHSDWQSIAVSIDEVLCSWFMSLMFKHMQKHFNNIFVSQNIFLTKAL